MSKPKNSLNHTPKSHAFRGPLKRTLITNLCLAGIIFMVYLAAFGPIGNALSGAGPALKGSTGEDVVGLQIVVDDGTDIAAYLDMLDQYDVKGTFFFGDQQTAAMRNEMTAVQSRGHGVGYYISGEPRAAALYIGGGFSIPVMSSAEENGAREVCPSIDLTKLTQTDGWAKVLSDTVAGDMFLYIRADNNFSDFEKVVQIVLDKGYTILKVSEML